LPFVLARGDWYTKAVLTVIATALATIALRPGLVPTPSYAARKIEYKVVRAFAPIESALNELGNDRWDVAGIVRVVGAGRP
jgi:hypothetical protein